MKKIAGTLVIVLVLLTSMVKGQKKAPNTGWPGVKYSYIKLYLYNLDNQLHGQYQALNKGKLNYTVVQPGVTLTSYQAKNLMTVINGDTRVLNEGLANCYEPHHAFVFYDENDNIVAASDVCFLCQGIRFYPAKKYLKPIKTYTEALTKDAEKKLNSIKKTVEETEIPVFNDTKSYIEFGKRLASDTLKLVNDSVFLNFFNAFSSIDKLKNKLKSVNELTIDSTIKVTGGGKKVIIYRMQSSKTTIECSSYSNGAIWITDFKTNERNADIIHKISIGDTKVEVYKALKPAFNEFFYNSFLRIKSTNGNESLVITFDQNSNVNFIKYYHYH